MVHHGIESHTIIPMIAISIYRNNSQHLSSHSNYNKTYNNSYNTNNSNNSGSNSRAYHYGKKDGGNNKKNEIKLVEDPSLNEKWLKLKEIAENNPSQIYEFNGKIDVVYDIGGILLVGQDRSLTLRRRQSSESSETSITPYKFFSKLKEIL